MTEKSALPIWRSDIQRDIADSETAQRLIVELIKFTPILQQFVTPSGNRTPSEQSNADARGQLSRIRHQAGKLQESLSSIGGKAEIEITRQVVRLTAYYELETGNSTDDSWEPLSSLADEVEKVIYVLDACIKGLSASRGHPRDAMRDFLIRCVALVFQKEAPDIQVSHKPTSLFYRVVDQYLIDLDVDSGNLGRTLKRLISERLIP